MVTPNELGTKTNEIEITMLLEALYAHHGYDFRQYSRDSITRRIYAFMAKYRIPRVTDVVARVRHDHVFFNLLLSEVSVTVTEMFRSPSVFRAFRENVLPDLCHKATLKVWVAGCATGEEAYSLAILLDEAGLLERTQIYATDINSVTLEKAAKGIIPTSRLRKYTANYHQVGGQRDFCRYYTVREDVAFLESFLRKRVLFTSHNLVHDTVFAEMDIIFCRNVMIYFTPELQHSVFQLFLDSLKDDGVLCLGGKESLYSSGFEHYFDAVKERERLYKRKVTKRREHDVA